MKQRQLGKGGPMVSAIGLGCMSFAGIFGPTDEAASLRCLAAACGAGMNFLDTANIYGMGVSETVILASKCGIMPGPPRRFDNSEAHISAELDASLKRLRRDHIELYYIHRRDPDIPVEDVEDVVGSLQRLTRASRGL